MKNNSSAPKFGRFNNPITGGILGLVIFLIIGGLYIVFMGTPITIISGIAISALGAFIWVMGEETHSTDKPREAGIITFWDTPVTFPWSEKWEEGVIIGGRVILANYPPFHIGSIRVNMDNAEKTFPFKVISKDKVPLEVNVSLTTRPNLRDILDYIQAGNDMNKVFSQIESIVFADVQSLCNSSDAEDIQSLKRGPDGKNILEHLDERIHKLFDAGSFGVEVFKVKIEAHLPDELLKKLLAIKIEDYERVAELKEYDTMYEAAKQLQIAYAREKYPQLPVINVNDDNTKKLAIMAEIDATIEKLVADKKIPDLNMCLEQVRTLRLVRDGQVIRVESTGRIGNMIISEFNANLGKKKG